MNGSEISRELLGQYLNRSEANVFGTMLAQSSGPATVADLSNSKIETSVELDWSEKPIDVGSVEFVGDMIGVGNC